MRLDAGAGTEFDHVVRRKPRCVDLARRAGLDDVIAQRVVAAPLPQLRRQIIRVAMGESMSMPRPRQADSRLAACSMNVDDGFALSLAVSAERTRNP